MSDRVSVSFCYVRLMNGLERTFQFLESTTNPSSLDVLVPALNAAQASIRSRAISAIVCRDNLQGYRHVIEQWPKLGIDDRLLLVDSSPAFLAAVEATLTSGDEERLLNAIDIVVTLDLNPLLPVLVVPAESHVSHAVRKAAQAAVFHIASEEGTAARNDRERPAERRPMLRTLATSVARFPVHQQSALVDSMLAASCQNDSQLLTMLADGSESLPIVLQRLESSSEAAVASLLAGMIHRQRLSVDIEAIITRRADRLFRDQFLDAIGCHLTTTTRKNLAVIGLPACCEPQHTDIETLPYARRVALALVYAVADRDHVRALTMLLDALDSVEHADPKYATGLAHALSRFPALSSPLLLRAAASRMSDIPASERSGDACDDPDARLLHRMLRWLKVEGSPFRRPLRAILNALTVQAVMPQLESVRVATRKRLGQVVLQVDPDATTVVADQLRHPVLKRRLEGIRAAVALDIVDRLSDPLVRMALNDHLEARVQAIEALRFDRRRSSYQALFELSTGPVGSIRDAAIQSLHHRDSRA